MKSPEIRKLVQLYRSARPDIEGRLAEFHRVWLEGSDEDIFAELVFCLLTPQSKAKSCWNAVEVIRQEGLLLKGAPVELRDPLRRCVRFHNKKADYIAEARNKLMDGDRISIRPAIQSFPDIGECRDWLVKNLKGLGYKEASHFLRNIGLGDEITILDRHILRNLQAFGVLSEIPASLGRETYIRVEDSMKNFAHGIGIPVAHLDLLLWYKETGEIFK